MKRIVAWLFLAASAAFASSTTITIVPAGAGPGAIPTAVGDRNAWILSTFGSGWNPQTLESFESFGFGPYNSLSTGVGTFSVMPGSQPGDYWQSNGTKTDQFTILNSSDTPFSGRFNTTPGGNNWLDSNDITQIQLTTSLSTLFFFITDVNDIGGTLTIRTADGASSANFAPNAADGNLYFVGIHSSGSIGSVQWLNNSNNDGWGLDDFGTAVDPPPPPHIYTPAVPEPSSWPIAAAALIAIPVIRKYRARAGQAKLERLSETSA
ncbi:MAG TPA: hypothetical protein VEV17_18745 [Bryobacteraceae bacterium]|nr:hypothetical protein [Bryobacteraceae bacterium]